MAYRIIDIDTHVMEPESMWLEYLPSEFRDIAPRTTLDGEGYVRRIVGGITFGRMVKPPPGGSSPEPGGFDPKARLDRMDAEGVEAQVLYPTLGSSTFPGLPDLDVTIAFCQAYNNWMNDFRSTAPSRLLPMAVVPQRSLLDTLAEARRAIGELGLPGLLLRPNAVGGRTIGDPAWDPLWSFLEEADVPLGIHEGSGSGVAVGALGEDRSDDPVFRHVMSHPFEHMQAMLHLIVGGVLERHPRLRVCFVEAGCGWVPYWLERLEHHVDQWSHMMRPLPLRPTEYFLRQCFVSADSEESRGVTAVLAAMGSDGICWSTDYPHSDHTWEGVTAAFVERSDISPSDKANILGLNAARAYKL